MTGEDGAVVGVEPDNHTAPDIKPSPLNGMNPAQKGVAGAHVLKFLGFTKGIFVGTFDADKDGDKVRSSHQFKQFGIVSQVERCLSEQRHRIAMFLLPSANFAENFLDGFFIADQVVVHDKHGTHSAFVHGVQFQENLAGIFETRATTECHDNIAEFALKRASA